MILKNTTNLIIHNNNFKILNYFDINEKFEKLKIKKINHSFLTLIFFSYTKKKKKKKIGIISKGFLFDIMHLYNKKLVHDA
jgi:hypothetical protein